MTDRKNTYFISDIHLGASYIKDARAHERRIVDFLHSIAGSCCRLVLLGDILDFWWEYRKVVPRGFVRFFGTLASLADAGVEIIWFKGNHDIWIFDYLPRELGIKLHDGSMVCEIDGKRFFLEHGDGVGELPASFRHLRSLFRNRFAQRLFSTIHPRWAIGFAHRWSSHSRKQGGYVPSAGAKENLIRFAEAYNASRPDEKIDFFIFGHYHILVQEKLADGAELAIIGDWIQTFSYAVWDGHSLSTHLVKNSNF